MVFRLKYFVCLIFLSLIFCSTQTEDQIKIFEEDGVTIVSNPEFFFIHLAEKVRDPENLGVRSAYSLIQMRRFMSRIGARIKFAIP